MSDYVSDRRHRHRGKKKEESALYRAAQRWGFVLFRYYVKPLTNYGPRPEFRINGASQEGWKTQARSVSAILRGEA